MGSSSNAGTCFALAFYFDGCAHARSPPPFYPRFEIMRLEIDAIVPAPPVATDADNKAREDSTDFAEARSSLDQGIKAAQAGNRTQARASLLRATELDPHNENGWLWLASISEYPEELLGFLSHVLAINPTNERAVEWKAQTHSLLSRTFVQRGIDASNEGQKEFALECFQTALEHDERNAVAWMWMASLSDSTADKITLLQRAVAIDPQNEEAASALSEAKNCILKDKLNQARSAAVAGNNGEAIDILDDLLQVDPSSVEAWTMRSHLSESFDDKIRCFDNILSIDPENIAAKAGRDSLLALFGETHAVRVSETNEHAEPADGSNVVFAEFGQSEPEPSAVQAFDPAATLVDLYPATEQTQLVTEPAVTQKEDEPHYSFEEPPHSLAEEAEAPIENASTPEQLGVEESPEYAFMPTVVSYDEPVEEVPADFAAPAEDLSEPQTATSNFAPFVETSEVEVPDHQAETVVYSYPELSGDWGIPSSGSFETRRSDPEIPMPAIDLPRSAPVSNDSAAPVTFVEPRSTLHAEHEPVVCAFCGKENEPQSVACGRCRAVLTLSDLEMLLGNNSADKLLVRQAVEEMERYRLARPFNASELVTLGIGHLNLKNLQYGYDCLLDASRMTPNDVVLSGQVNSLLIRLDEIRQQEEAHLRMPKGKSILVVDDSPTVRKLIAGKLEKCGHEVVCANDGVEAMERLEHFLPDLVLLDINMPRMDGYQVCKLIRSNDTTKNVAVVMISGKDGFFDKVRGRMAGTTGYITKPFGPEALMKAVEMYLSGEVPDPEVEE